MINTNYKRFDLRGITEYLKIDDVICLYWANKYQHGASIKITKINKKTIKGIEIEGSYQPNTLWSIAKDANMYIDNMHNSQERFNEIVLKYWAF